METVPGGGPGSVGGDASPSPSRGASQVRGSAAPAPRWPCGPKKTRPVECHSCRGVYYYLLARSSSMHSMTATRHSYAYYIVPVMLSDVLGVPIDRQGDKILPGAYLLIRTTLVRARSMHRDYHVSYHTAGNSFSNVRACHYQ